MASKFAHKSHRRNASAEAGASALLHDLLGGGIALLAVVTPLVSSEGSPQRGAELWLAVGWLVLLVLWGVTVLQSPRPEIRWTWVETWLAAFLGWLALSTWQVDGEGNLRAAFNGFWDHAHLLVAYFLIRQWITTDRQRHALVAVMLCAATFAASYGLYQYAFIMPANQAAFEADPAAILAANGIDPSPDNPLRILFRNRLYSTEPTATFTLTNSLAGFLVPWILIALGWLKNALAPPRYTRRIAGLVLMLLLTGICLLLTKSRTAWLATLFGFTLLGLYGTTIGRRVSWVIPAAGLTIFLGLFMLGFATGVLDVEILSEAPKSVLSRLQYWQGAAAIVADHPIFGVGPANFQGYYPQYMLPMASETVADPHNFVFELWATAGTPALLFFLAAMAAWARSVARASRESDPPSTTAEGATKATSDDARAAVPLWFGGGIALLVSPFVQGVMQEVQPDFEMLLVGLLPALAVGYTVWGTPLTGQLRLWATIAVAALVIDLLAAGGISFPSVAGSLYLLAALTMPLRPAKEVSDITKKCLPAALGVIGLVLVIGWGIQPTAASRTQMAFSQFALQQGNWREAEGRLHLAVAADPWGKDAPNTLADFYRQAWLQNVRAEPRTQAALLGQFEATLAEAFRRGGNTFPLHFSAGHWYLEIYRHSGQRPHLEKAIAHYRQAAELFPSKAIHHAQLAWVWHLAGSAEQSHAAAEEALRLDALNPHAERALENLKITDFAPQPPRDNGEATTPEPPSRDLSAKQVVESLRTMER